ncbi:polypeptide N-acetylgalactosaminyltransferase 5-like [Tubulanus polymorphus]|uniref:polypeptide N-acetylgalactosaminyltransferase 5-like n=1 Tax=Tubulanus polymorphus TaxID=672921 RepID=UPI003DA29C4B
MLSLRRRGLFFKFSALIFTALLFYLYYNRMDSSSLVDEREAPVVVTSAVRALSPEPEAVTIVPKNVVVEPKRSNLFYIEANKPRNESSPGEMARPVLIEKSKLNTSEREKYDKGWKQHDFNQYASDLVSVRRSLPDFRQPECKDLKYKEILPEASVIVCFHNEAWSVLLRTVHSVIDRSPDVLLKEVLLIDDYSDLDHLKAPLDDYMANLHKVRIVRAKRREGLIRARLLGASEAKGTVLVYLDSHCECSRGWLEPLLDRIADNKTHVVTPVIDQISSEDLHYMAASVKAVGGFHLTKLSFDWTSIQSNERVRLQNLPSTTPIRSPTMAGGLFAISREYFQYLGTYDPGMDIWGGENLEISFKIWMCGGSLEIVPCSRVGHIFRKRIPYSWGKGGSVVQRNTVRLAEVWMDDYKKFYYERINNNPGEFGDVSDRKELRSRLKCQSFDWYVKNIYPDIFIPSASIASGEIRNKAADMCVDALTESVTMEHSPVKMWPCHNQGGNQFWLLSKNGEIRRDEKCVDLSEKGLLIFICHGTKGNQEWNYRQDQRLEHVATGKCLEMGDDKNVLLANKCDESNDRQVWFWKRKTPESNSR